MNQYAVVIVYKGDEATPLAVGKAIEAMARAGIRMDDQTIQPRVFNEKDVAVALVREAIADEQTVKVECVNEEEQKFNESLNYLINVIKRDGNKMSVEASVLRDKYVSAKIGLGDPEFRAAVESLYDSNRRLTIMKAIKTSTTYDIVNIKDAIDGLFKTVEVCRARIAE